jgi:hypothetical protein
MAELPEQIFISTIGFQMPSGECIVHIEATRSLINLEITKHGDDSIDMLKALLMAAVYVFDEAAKNFRVVEVSHETIVASLYEAKVNLSFENWKFETEMSLDWDKSEMKYGIKARIKPVMSDRLMALKSAAAVLFYMRFWLDGIIKALEQNQNEN